MNNQALVEIIKEIHRDCYLLCKQSFDEYFSNANNVGIFTQSDEEYKKLTELKDKLVLNSVNPKQKYFELKEPIIIPGNAGIPMANYTHLYIRKPDKSEYGKHRGDVDFYVTNEEYHSLLQDVGNNNVKGARVYKQEGIGQLIELYDEDVNSLAYVSTKEMTESLRVKH